MPEWNFVIAAYTLTWVGLLGYALRLAYGLRAAADDLAAMDAPRPDERHHE